MSKVLELTERLMRCESVSPDDAGCQAILGTRLAELGFELTSMPFEDVTNLWAIHGSGSPVFVFAGHTDVVPPGPLGEWTSAPFEPRREGNLLFGRGAADMKGSLAAMTEASGRFLAVNRDHPGTLAFLITSDEEADAINGTVRCMELLTERNVNMNWCVVGEPSSTSGLGDVVRVGRRGSLNCTLTVHGVQGHVAYPDDADNPVHRAAAAITELTAEVWDAGNRFFPPTSMQISNIHAGTGVTNVIPGELQIQFNFRFSTEQTEASLREATEAIFARNRCQCSIEWRLSGNPFLTTGGELIPAVQAAISAVTGRSTELSTSGGTSDGRFIAPHGVQVVELGPRNHSIHKIDEHVEIDELDLLADVYADILVRLLGPDSATAVAARSSSDAP